MKKLAKWQPLDNPKRSTGTEAAAGAAQQQPTSTSNSTGEGADYFVPWHLAPAQTKSASATSTGGGGGGGGEQPAAVEGVVYQRYYHLFTKEELVALVEQGLGTEVAKVERIIYDKDNWVIVFERIKLI